MPPRAVLFTFTAITREFTSLGERNTFYRGLYGCRVTVKKGTRTYVYNKDGILGETPHLRVDKSTIIIHPRYAKRVQEYLEAWRPKVRHSRFTVIIDKKTWNEMMATHKKLRDNQE